MKLKVHVFIHFQPALCTSNLKISHQLKYMCPVKRICVFEHSSWQILTAHAQPFRGARDLAFCLKVPLDSLLVWASSESSGETARMRRLAWTFAARIGDKYQIRLTRSIYKIWPKDSIMRLINVRNNLFTQTELANMKLVLFHISVWCHTNDWYLHYK